MVIGVRPGDDRASLFIISFDDPHQQPITWMAFNFDYYYSRIDLINYTSYYLYYFVMIHCFIIVIIKAHYDPI